ncbi:1-hydroxycarotenoid 3,4-desaturase CrtD [Methylopila turkensis]|nr:1-hydroxycarotenoid 3,4-desaturase CrtD [Methylopila turkensis]
MTADRVVVIGAGIGGLVAAAILARRGLDVTVLEKATGPGGKMRTVTIGGQPIDAGPTVFTMRSLIQEIATEAGFVLDDALTLRSVETLARHAWGPDQRLDLFADPLRTADAIGDFSGAQEARRFLAFHAEAAHVFKTLDQSFIRAAEPSRASLVLGAGLRGLSDLARIRPFSSLWSALGGMFADPRLRQLFGRYATYCGSSPFLAPATLMLVAHVEMDGVWLVEGGMTRVAEAFEAAAKANGATFRYGADVARIEVEHGRVSGARLRDGETIAARAVVFNGDVAALAKGLLAGASARKSPHVKPSERSLSAVTFCWVAKTVGFPLARHSVFFSDAYEAEFSDIFDRARLPERPTVYVCAQDRDDAGNLDAQSESGAERLMLLVNAPPVGDVYQFGREEIARCEANATQLMNRCGLTIEPSDAVVTTPNDFAEMFPGTAGALYGPASHGANASFRRATARSSLPGLYLAGGSVHPGPGVPMAAISGRQAARSLIQDLGSIARFRPEATPGGMSTAGATTEPTA